MFAVVAEEDGSLNGSLLTAEVNADGNGFVNVTLDNKNYTGNVFCDFYIKKAGNTVSELQIDAANFAGYYYVEASTLFRRQNDGKDLPAEITFPNVKIQSNFTFTMASTGDPSTFTFTMDAMPGYTYFDPKKKVLCVMQIIDEDKDPIIDNDSVMAHDKDRHEKGVDKDSAGEYESGITGDVISFNRTVAPEINEDEGVLTWNAIDGSAGYELTITDNEGNREEYVSKPSYVLNDGETKVIVTPKCGNLEGASGTWTKQ